MGLAGSVRAERAARASVSEALGTKELGEAVLAVALVVVDAVLGHFKRVIAVAAVRIKKQ